MPRYHNHCPLCRTPTLSEVPFQEQHVYQCTNCEGFWFEDEELNTAISDFHADIDSHCHVSHLGDHMGQGERECRNCHVPMEHHHLLADYSVEIDRCSRCDGVWVDHDEVEQVLRSPQIINAMQALNQRVSWRSWLFQFLTQMPVEYNVKSHRRPYVTYGLIVICTLIYLLGLSSDEAETSILLTFAVQTESLGTLPMFWQMLSYQFLHGGLLHLLGNMYCLWIIGDNIEDALGHRAYLGLYLIAGVVAAITELLWHATTVGGPMWLVGASGSIAALFGLYLMWFRFSSLTFMFIVYQKKLSPLWFFIIWSGINLLGMLQGGTEVAYAAHLGGFAFGLMGGYLLRPRIERDNPLLRLLNAPEARLRR